MPMEFGSVAIVVSNGKKSAQWFKDKLGFEVRSQEGHWITVAPKGADTVIHLCEGDTLEPGNTGFAFYVKDAIKEEANLRKKGVEFTSPVTKESWGTNGMFKDPDGNEFYLIEE